MRPITAADVMNPNVLVVQEDMTLDELAQFLIENEISGAPVEDEDGRLTGVVSVTDLARAVAHETDRPGSDFYVREWDAAPRWDVQDLRYGEGTRVRDIMTPSVFSVDEQTPIPEVAETLIKSHIHRLLVTREARVVGIVTTSDLLGLLVREPR